MILKKGDNNEIVKKIQVVLGVDPVGNFGPKTEEAVKAWQTKNGLTPDGIVGPASLAKMGIVVEGKAAAPAAVSGATKYSKDKVEAAVKAKGYKWFEDKDYHLNIVGVRNSDTGQKVTNAFDDKMTLSFKVNGAWEYREWSNTTDPGKKGVMEYQALKQFKPVTVYRDANKDMNYDENKTATGVFGINIHKAGVDSTYVENWSEGCQVFKKAADFEAFMAIVRKSAAAGYKSFTYTLIESKDIV